MNKTKNIKKIFDNSLDIKAIVTFKKTNRKIIQKEQEILKKWNITLTQFGVLKILYHKEKSNVQDLIDSLFTTSGNMTLVLTNMEKNNLIKKEKNAHDKRLCLISLTEKGKNLINEIFPAYFEFFSKFLLNFTDDEKTKFIELLLKV